MTHHLAQLNIARARYTNDDPRFAEFMDALDEINALAEAAPGFVWRLQDEGGNATEIRIFDDDMLLVNLSVWEDVESLHAYVYRTDHTPFLRRRGEWFEKMEEPHLVMWWVPAGHIPSTDEAKERLERLRRDVSGPEAFTFRSPEPPPD